jgi:hypothetical protein
MPFCVCKTPYSSWGRTTEWLILSDRLYNFIGKKRNRPTYCLYHQGDDHRPDDGGSTYLETSVHFKDSTRRLIPQGCHFQFIYVSLPFHQSQTFYHNAVWIWWRNDVKYNFLQTHTGLACMVHTWAHSQTFQSSHFVSHAYNLRTELCVNQFTVSETANKVI